MTREEAIKAWDEWRENGYSHSAMPNSMALVMAYNALRVPESLRPTAHWEKEMADGPDVVKYTSLLSVVCGRCRRRAWTKSTYCPHCGAKMEG